MLHFVLITVLLSIDAFALENKLIGAPQVVCDSDSVEVSAKSLDYFGGNVYIQNWRKTEECSKLYMPSINSTKDPTFNLSLKDLSKCGLELKKSIDSDNLELFFVLVFSFHQNFMTANDRTFTIYCIYPPDEISINSRVNDIPDITTKGIFGGTSFAPLPIFKVVAGKVPDETLNQAQSLLVGDSLTLIWRLPDNSEIYGFHVHECTVESNGRSTQIIADGCSLDKSLVDNVQYSENNKKAFADGTAFKFPDTEGLWIKCKLELCIQNHQHLKVDSKLPNALCKATNECNRRKKRDANLLDENVIVLNNKIIVLDSYKNNMTESSESKEPTPKNNEWCMMKSHLSAIIALSTTIYTTAMIALLIYYKIIYRNQK